jgi:outer membrane protein
MGTSTWSWILFVFTSCLWIWLSLSPAYGQLQGKVNLVNSGCITLADSVSAGLLISDEIKIQKSEAAVAAEQYSAAKASVLPTIKASAAVLKQDNSKITSRAEPESFQTTAKVTLNQPLYAGGAEYAAIRKTSKQAEAGAKMADAARIKVIRDLTSSFFQVLSAQAELQSSAELRDVSKRRAKEIRARVGIGRSRAVDGLGADAQLASSEAQYESSRLALDAAKRHLSSEIGREVQNVCDISPKVNGHLKDWDDVRQKVQKRPDLAATDLAVSAAGDNVAIARAGHQPSLEFGANYYVKRPETQKTYGNWDVSLSASLPIYSGGMVGSKVNEALAVEQKQLSIARQLKQSAEDEARDLWESHVTGRTQVASLEEASKKSAQYYQAMANDERKGLASSLETLQALNASIDTLRAFQKAKLKFEETIRQLHLVTNDVEGALR